MAGGIDHLVLCVGDLDRARDLYRRLGFTLTPPARHPFGTGNSLVQFEERSFLELLAVIEPAAIPPARPGAFSFGAYNRDFLARQEGCSMLVLETGDAQADARAWSRAGLGDFAPFHFERPAKLPDGTTAKVAFTLAFAVHPALPEAVFFSCRQHAPELFWKAEYQRHANGATGIAEVALAADDPPALAEILEAICGRPAERAEGGIALHTARGALCVLTPAGFAQRYGGAAAPPLARGPRFAGCRIEVEEPEALEERLHKVHIRWRKQDGVLAVAPEDAFGVALAFGQRSKR